jgi:peptidoglycan/LPS O-acetylase OafA/YrhL
MSTVHVQYLDGWRGLAITMLLWGHFFPVPGINFGTIGVNLFFVLSGLLMGRLLFIREVPLPQFYKRRIARIFPAVFVFLALVVLWHALSGRVIDWREVLAAATFTNNYFIKLPEETFMPFGHIWSLCVEEHSYILLSLLAVLARRKNIKPLWSVLAAVAAMFAIAIGYLQLYQGRALAFHMAHSEVSAIAIFASVLILLHFQGRKVPSLTLPMYAGLVLFGMLLHWWSVPGMVRTLFGIGALALAVNLLDRAPRLAQRVLEWYPLRQMGLWSFSLYLWQQPFYMAVHRHELPAALGVALGLACGVASFYLVENPARLFLNRRWDAPRPAPSSAPEAA